MARLDCLYSIGTMKAKKMVFFFASELTRRPKKPSNLASA
jgi:hypothetical protein